MLKYRLVSIIILLLMPRGGRSSSRSPRRSSFGASKPATQAPTRPTQQPQQSGGMFSGLGSMMMTGMAFGAGSAVAHQAVRGVMGGSHNADNVEEQPQQVQQQQSLPCQYEITNFTNCLKDNKEISYCQRYSDMLKMCQENLK